jgi:hypothetical protein
MPRARGGVTPSACPGRAGAPWSRAGAPRSPKRRARPHSPPIVRPATSIILGRPSSIRSSAWIGTLRQSERVHRRSGHPLDLGQDLAGVPGGVTKIVSSKAGPVIGIGLSRMARISTSPPRRSLPRRLPGRRHTARRAGVVGSSACGRRMPDRAAWSRGTLGVVHPEHSSTGAEHHRLDHHRPVEAEPRPTGSSPADEQGELGLGNLSGSRAARGRRALSRVACAAAAGWRQAERLRRQAAISTPVSSAATIASIGVRTRDRYGLGGPDRVSTVDLHEAVVRPQGRAFFGGDREVDRRGLRPPRRSRQRGTSRWGR